jgi:dolichol-phosphate mannosyltransferase
MGKLISVCIPTYNEEKNIVKAVESVEKVFADQLPGYRLELIITDNASADATWRLIKELAVSRDHLKAVRFSRNFGYQNSIFAGLSLSTGDAVIELDADLEDPPGVIPKFIEKWELGNEVVYGVRAKRYGNWLTLALTKVFYRILDGMSEFRIPRDAGDFRLLDRKVVSALVAFPERNLYLRGLVAFLGFRQVPVEYDRQPRISGHSKFRFMHYVVLAIDAITAFSKAPLRIIGVLGTLLFLGSILLALYYLGVYLVGGIPVPGVATIVILMVGLNGVVIKSHGGADRVSFANAVRVAVTEARNGVPGQIGELLARVQLTSVG